MSGKALPNFEFATTASFDIDAQKTFTPLCPNELPVPKGDEIVAELNLQAEYAAYRIASKEAHNPAALWVNQSAAPGQLKIPGVNIDLAWPVHAVPGTLGFEQLDGLPHPTGYDYFVWKGIELDMHPYGACYHDLANQLSTGVIEFLHSRSVKTVIIGGLALDHCVKVTALQLRQAGFDVIVNLAATRAITEAGKAETLAIFETQKIYVIHSAGLLSHDH